LAEEVKVTISVDVDRGTSGTQFRNLVAQNMVSEGELSRSVVDGFSIRRESDVDVTVSVTVALGSWEVLNTHGSRDPTEWVAIQCLATEVDRSASDQINVAIAIQIGRTRDVPGSRTGNHE
jgi:hypothetical protein